MTSRLAALVTAVAELSILAFGLWLALILSPFVTVLVSLALGLLGLFAGITGSGLPRLRGRLKGVAIFLVAGAFAVVASQVYVEQRKIRWAELRQTDPDAYLAEVATMDQARWLVELRELRPSDYQDEMARREATAEARRQTEAVEVQRRAEELKTERQAAEAREAEARQADADRTTLEEAATNSRLDADDFFWDEQTIPFQAEIVEIVNRITREHQRCRDPDPQSVALSSRSSPGTPVFFVTCGQGVSAYNVWFSPEDARNGREFRATAHVERTAAVEACERAAWAQAAHPSTVTFSRFLSLSFTRYDSGRARITSKFTARNTLNLELTFSIDCLFDSSNLIEVTVFEVAG